MPPKVQSIPQGCHTLTPHLVVRDASLAIEFYKLAFGAEERRRMPGPGGKGVLHAELQIGDSVLFLCDEFELSSTSGEGSSKIKDGYLEVTRFPLLDVKADHFGTLKNVRQGEAVAVRCRNTDPDLALAKQDGADVTQKIAPATLTGI